MMHLELKMLDKLLKKAQEDCFNKKTITESTYQIKADVYKKRKACIKHTIPVLETIAGGKKIKKKFGKIKNEWVLEVKKW